MTPMSRPSLQRSLADAIEAVASSVPSEDDFDRLDAEQIAILVRFLEQGARNLRLAAADFGVSSSPPALRSAIDAVYKAHATLQRIRAAHELIPILGDLVVLAQAAAIDEWAVVDITQGQLQQRITNAASMRRAS